MNFLLKLQKNYFCRYKYKHKEPWIDGFFDTRSLFIHIPKNAGTSISLTLYGEDPHHYPIKDYNFLTQKHFSSFFKFAVVRNPYERLYSIYKYSFKQTQKHPLTSVAFVTQYHSFESFITNWLNKENVNKHYFFQQQMNYIELENGNLGVDYLARFENLDHDFQYVCNQLNLTRELPKANQSNYEMNNKVYTQSLANLVYDVYQDDFIKLNYDKESWKDIIR